MDQAFSLLRKYARTRNLRLSDLAQAFIDGSETVTGLTVGRPPRLPGAGQVGHQHRPGSGPKP
jgi:hypothetical protein